MDLTTDLTGLTEGDLLDHAEAVARTQRECEVQTLRIAVQHAVTNDPDRLDPALTTLPGRERAGRFGGIGTPDVAEFCCAELGARLGITSWSASSLMADALDLVIRLPRLWRRVEALVLGAVAASDPEAAAAREEEQARRQVASPTRSTEDGMRGFYVRAP